MDELDYGARLLIGKGMDAQSAAKALEVSLQRLIPLERWDKESLETAIRPLCEELELKAGQLFGVLRIATTGRTAAPPLFETMAVLGKERCLKRLEAALDKLHKMPA